MSDYYNAFEMSPVPAPEPDAVPPEPFHGIYGMPMFVTIPTRDLAGSVEFWTRGIGFFELFSIPGRLVHLRRWAFQDVLLVPDDAAADQAEPPIRISFACVLSELEQIAESCNAVVPGSASAPFDTPWTTRDVAIRTPEQAHVVLTAAKVAEPGSADLARLAEMGILAPQGEGDNGTDDA